MLLFLFLNYWLILFNSCSFAQIFNPIAELQIPTKEAKTEIETHPVIVEAKIRKGSI